GGPSPPGDTRHLGGPQLRPVPGRPAADGRRVGCSAALGRRDRQGAIACPGASELVGGGVLSQGRPGDGRRGTGMVAFLGGSHGQGERLEDWHFLGDGPVLFAGWSEAVRGERWWRGLLPGREWPGDEAAVSAVSGPARPRTGDQLWR